MSDPIYIAQTWTSHDHQQWWLQRRDEAVQKGATFFRFSYHPDNPNLLLIEGWASQPKDQGEVRWQLSPEPKP
jgi:hypothetical protein